MLRSCLLIREGRPSVDILEVAAVLLELALLLETKGQLEEGEEAARRALAIRERILGSQHPDVGIALLGEPLCWCILQLNWAGFHSVIEHMVLSQSHITPEMC